MEEWQQGECEMQQSPVSRQASSKQPKDDHPTRPNHRAPPTSLSARACPVSSLLAPRTPFKGNCLGISFLQIECFYRHSVHCDFFPYNIGTIQSNLLLQQSCISCVSQSHIARRVQLLSERAGTFPVASPSLPWRAPQHIDLCLGL